MSEAAPGESGMDTSMSGVQTMSFKRTFIHYLGYHRNAVKRYPSGRIDTGWSKLPWQSTHYYLKPSDIIGMANLSTRWRVKDVHVKLSQFTAISDITTGVSGAVDLTVQPSNMGWFFFYKDDQNLLFPCDLNDYDDVNSSLPNYNGIENIPKSRANGLLPEYSFNITDFTQRWLGTWNKDKTEYHGDIQNEDYELLNSDQWSIHHTACDPINISWRNPSPKWNLLSTWDASTYNLTRGPQGGTNNSYVISGFPLNSKWSAWGNMHCFINNQSCISEGLGNSNKITNLSGLAGSKNDASWLAGTRMYGTDTDTNFPQVNRTPTTQLRFDLPKSMYSADGGYTGEVTTPSSTSHAVPHGVALKDAISGDEVAHPMPGVLMKPMPVYTLDNKLHKATWVIVAEYSCTCEFERNVLRYNPRDSDWSGTGRGFCNSWAGCNATGLVGWQLGRHPFN